MPDQKDNRKASVCNLDGTNYSRRYLRDSSDDTVAIAEWRATLLGVVVASVMLWLIVAS